MSLKAKYQPVIDLLKQMGLDHLIVEEANGSLTIQGEVDSVQEKELLLKKIQQVNAENAMDIDFRVGIKGY